MHHSRLWPRAFAAALVVGSIISASYLLAENGGYSGKTTRGCNCHENNPNVNGVVNVEITGPQVVAPNSVSDYMITVTGGPAGTYGGFDLAATAGTFLPGPTSHVLNGELTHATPSNRSWSFQWQAPATEGVEGFVGVGQACDGSGDTDFDSWNYYGNAQGAQFSIQVTSTVGVEDLPIAGVALDPAQPNPFVTHSRIEYSLAAAGPVRLEVFDLNGRHLATLVSETLPPGRHATTWNGRADNGRKVASGVYFVRLQAAGKTLSQRVVKTAR